MLAADVGLLDTYSIIMIWAIRIAAKEDQIYKSVNAIYMIILAIIAVSRAAFMFINIKQSITTEDEFIAFWETVFISVTMTILMIAMNGFSRLGIADTIIFVCIIGLKSMNFTTILIVTGASTIAMLIELIVINIKRIKQKKKLESAAYIPWMHRAVMLVYIAYSMAIYYNN